MGIAKIARRTFLIGSAATVGGLAVGAYYYRRDYGNPLLKDAADGEAVFNPYVKIDVDGRIAVIVPRAEMGQGVSTTLAALVAEELDVQLADLTVEHGPASWAYFNNAVLADGGPFASFDVGVLATGFRAVGGVAGKLLGIQMTGGSSSTRDAYDTMRKAGAVTRDLLLRAAAERFAKPVESLKTEGGFVIDPSTGIKLAYSALALRAAKLNVPDTIELRKPAAWRVLGKPQQRADVAAKSTGKAQFGIDTALPDMLYATVRMNPHLGAPMKSFDASDAMKMPGVIKIVEIGNGVAVIADNTWRAFQAADAVKFEWDRPAEAVTTASMFSALEKRAGFGEGFAFRNSGNAAELVKAANPDDMIEAEYRAPFLAHATMEPMNATARWKEGKLDIWTPSQVPTLVQLAAAREFNIEPQNANVHVTMIGGGFGRRLEVDYDLYAMRAAKHTNGRPVKVTWTREEDMRHDVYRPAAIGRFRGVVSKGSLPVALDANIASPSILKGVVGRMWPYVPLAGPDKIVAEGAFDQPYDIPNYRVSGAVVDVPVPLGFWRSVGNSYNGFFHESFMDELAHKSGIDPIAMRLKLMANWKPAVKLVEKVAEMSAWGTPLPQGSGRGFAFTLSFGTWVAQAVQVATASDGAIRIENVWCAADLGIVLDPRIVEAQMQSAINFGLSAAIGQEILFEDSAVQQSNFHDYDAIRINQAPAIEVALLANSEWMGGAGEPGVPPSIPALANAIFAATGKRIRTLPLSKEVRFA